MQWNVDERCTSTIESSCDRAKSSSSPSYGDEQELIYTPSITNCGQPAGQPTQRHSGRGGQEKHVPIFPKFLLTWPLLRS
jgi:hypothetical protein